MIKVMTILMIILMVAALIRRIRRKLSESWREPPWDPSEGITPGDIAEYYRRRVRRHRRRPKGQTGRKHPKKKGRRRHEKQK